MDNKEFLQVTDKILLDYGFLKIKKYYYLDLSEIIIKLCLEKNRFDKSEWCFSFTFSIKDLNTEPNEIAFSIFNTHLLNMPTLFSNPKLFKVIIQDDSVVSVSIKKRGNCYFNPCNYLQNEWGEIFGEMINRYFNPFKENAIQAINAVNTKSNGTLFFAIKKEVAEYIKTKNNS